MLSSVFLLCDRAGGPSGWGERYIIRTFASSQVFPTLTATSIFSLYCTYHPLLIMFPIFSRDEVEPTRAGDSPSDLNTTGNELRLPFSHARVLSFTQACTSTEQCNSNSSKETLFANDHYEESLTETCESALDLCDSYHKNRWCEVPIDVHHAFSPDYSFSGNVYGSRDKWLGIPYINGRIDDGICVNGQRPHAFFDDDETEYLKHRFISASNF